MDRSPKRISKVRHLDSCSEHGSGSLFSGQNPLTTADPSSFENGEPKKPKAVALHGWQRTVAKDKDFEEESIPVLLGAPGTGLLQKAPSRNHGFSDSCGAIRTDPGPWEGLKVTREDMREAKTLRALPLAEGAAELPFPRVVSETDTDASSHAASSPAGSLDSPSKRRQRFETQSSNASSDLSFLVNTAGTGTVFGTRPTFGRAVDPRIPATVGEERLHNSLAMYFDRTRGGGNVGGGFARESRSSIVSPQDKDPAGGRGTMSSTPVTKTETRGSSLDDDFPAKIGLTADNATSASVKEAKRRDGAAGATGGTAGASGAAPRAPMRSGGASKKSTKRRGSAASTDPSAEDGLYAGREGVGGKKRIESDVPVEPGQRSLKCGCLRVWPWKVLIGLAMLVAVVTVVVMVNSGEDADVGRRLVSPPYGVPPTSNNTGGLSAASFERSRRILQATHSPGGHGGFGGREPPGDAGGRGTARRRRLLRGRGFGSGPDVAASG